MNAKAAKMQMIGLIIVLIQLFSKGSSKKRNLLSIYAIIFSTDAQVSPWNVVNYEHSFSGCSIYPQGTRVLALNGCILQFRVHN